MSANAEFETRPKESMKDIPEALRDQPETENQLMQRGIIISSLIGLGAIAILTGALFLRSTPESSSQPSISTSPQPTSTEKAQPTPKEKPQPTPTQPENILGHLPYQESPVSELKAITGDGKIKLRSPAAEKFLQMQAAAKANGIILTALSGFRSEEEQEYLFFQVKEKRAQVTTKRAEVSAPPGYSEHHTGYAIDIGDGKKPATNLSPDFEKTPAFRWLQENAPKYSFELSFPKDNPQGISYEPWHWRFVGDRHSLETFYKVRNIEQGIKNND